LFIFTSIAYAADSIDVEVQSKIGNEFAFLHVYGTPAGATENAMKTVAKDARERLKVKRANVLFYAGNQGDTSTLVGYYSSIAPDKITGKRFSPPWTDQERIKSFNLAPYYEIKAANLVTRYKNNEVVADDDFKGKRISVTGRVQEVGKDFTGAAYVYLVSDKYGFEGVRCYVDKADPTLRLLKRGDSAAISGVVKGFVMKDVGLEKCYIFPPDMMK